MWRLLYDERPIRFRDQEEEAVWLCFNRRCGLNRSEAKLVGGWVGGREEGGNGLSSDMVRGQAGGWVGLGLGGDGSSGLSSDVIRGQAGARGEQESRLHKRENR